MAACKRHWSRGGPSPVPRGSATRGSSPSASATSTTSSSPSSGWPTADAHALGPGARRGRGGGVAVRARSRPVEAAVRVHPSRVVPIMAGAADVARGPARVDRRTKRLLVRLLPGDVAVIDHEDLDRVAAEALVRASPVAVVNAAKSISGRY